jgi:ABC-type phosphate/phosphonate transport system substrate-binding protein
MSKQRIIVSVAAFVILMVGVAGNTARQAPQRRPTSPAAQPNQALNLGAPPPRNP